MEFESGSMKTALSVPQCKPDCISEANVHRVSEYWSGVILDDIFKFFIVNSVTTMTYSVAYHLSRRFLTFSHVDDMFFRLFTLLLFCKYGSDTEVAVTAFLWNCFMHQMAAPQWIGFESLTSCMVARKSKTNMYHFDRWCTFKFSMLSFIWYFAIPSRLSPDCGCLSCPCDCPALYETSHVQIVGLKYNGETCSTCGSTKNRLE